MLHAMFAFVAVERFGFLRSVVGQPANDLRRRDRRTGNAIKLDAITSRQDKPLGAIDLGGGRIRVALPRLDVRGVMADANAKEVHCGGSGCPVKLIAHKTDTAALKATMQRRATRFGAS